MGRPEECANVILEGNLPSQIAQQLKVNCEYTLIPYLYVAIGKGYLHISDLVFSIPEMVRTDTESIIEELATDDYALICQKIGARQIAVNKDDLRLYLRLRGHVMGDMYFFLSDLERNLHALIKKILEVQYGQDGRGWWHLGVLETVRVECVARRERDPGYDNSPYRYTDFIHLKQILEHSCGLFSKHLPNEEARDKPALMKGLVEANTIRNKVMHPVRGSTPSDHEFRFIRQLRIRLERSKWSFQKANKCRFANFAACILCDTAKINRRPRNQQVPRLGGAQLIGQCTTSLHVKPQLLNPRCSDS